MSRSRRRSRDAEQGVREQTHAARGSAPLDVRDAAFDVAHAWQPRATAGQLIDTLGTIGCVYLALITIGFACFRLLPTLPPGASHNSDRTFFASVNAVTMTGFAQNFATTAGYPTSGRALLVGLAVGGALAAMIGGGAFLRHVLGGRWMSLPKLSLIAAGLVTWPLVFSPTVGWFEALSAGSGVGYAPVDVSSAWRWVLLSASLPASSGPLLIVALLAKRMDRRSSALWIALAAAFFVFLVAFRATMPDMRTTSGSDVAAFEAFNTRSLGLATHAQANLPSGMTWLMIAAMCVGAGPASISGGLSLLPIVLAGSGAIAALRGRRVVPIVGVAFAWIAAFVAALCVLMALFASTNQAMPGDRQLFLLVSAFCNVGLSFDPLGITGSGLFVLSAAMIAGRALPMIMLCWMAIVAEQTTFEEGELAETLAAQP